MTKNEALKAAIDGKQVKAPLWDDGIYLVWESGTFKIYSSYLKGGASIYGSRFSENPVCHAVDDGWQIVPKYVDFAEAWKAYESGKTIKCVHYSQQYKKSWFTCPAKPCTFTENEIRGKWLILEDE